MEKKYEKPDVELIDLKIYDSIMDLQKPSWEVGEDDEEGMT